MINAIPVIIILLAVFGRRRARSRLVAGLVGLGRWLRPVQPGSLWARFRFDPAAYGLPSRDALDAGRAGPPLPPYRIKEIQALAHAARDGDWRAAAAYVEAAGQDWDMRWSRTELLEEIAQQDSGWVDAWRRAQPDSCDAATVLALLMVHRAWAVRGSGYVHEVPPADLAKFRALLPAAIEAARQAARLAPENPGPWVVMITAARGARYAPRDFEELWAGLYARAPYHYAAHWQAQQYWCRKWCGTDAEMLGFARAAVERAPAGSPLAGMYLFALQELEARDGRVGLSREGKALLLRTAHSLRSVRANDERMPQLRHLLAHYLVRGGFHDEALEQFRLIGPWCRAVPWTRDGRPVAAFDRARAKAARKSTGARPGDTPGDEDRTTSTAARGRRL